MNNIIGELADQFGIAPAQAESAAGSILGFLQQEVSNGDFQKLLAAAPQLQDWIAKAAPAQASGGGGLLGEIGSLLGGASGGTIGNVVAALQHSGLNMESIAQFVPALVQKLSANIDPALLSQLVEQVPALKELANGSGGLGALGGLLSGFGKS